MKRIKLFFSFFLTSFAHVFYGALTVLAAKYNSVISLVMFFAFLFYELNEDMHLDNGAYRALFEYMLGLILALFLEFGTFLNLTKV